MISCLALIPLQALILRVNWNSLLCSPTAIPPQAAILLNLINYRGGCGWINSPKGNLSCKLALLRERVSGLSRWHSFLGVSWGSPLPESMEDGRFLCKKPTAALGTGHSCSNTAANLFLGFCFFFFPKKLLYSFPAITFVKKEALCFTNKRRILMQRLCFFTHFRNRFAMLQEMAILSCALSEDSDPCCSRVCLKIKLALSVFQCIKSRGILGWSKRRTTLLNENGEK